MEFIEGNTILFWMMAIFIVILVAIIFMLMVQKQFNITNVPIEVEDFLNKLYEENTKSNVTTDKAVNTFIGQLQSYEKQHEKTKEGLNNFIIHIMKELKETKEHVSAIQQLSLEKEEKIKRYEAGYDYSKIKNFTKGLFRIIEFIEHENINAKNPLLNEIKEDILLVLENNGIEQIDVQINANYGQYKKVAKVIETVDTDDESKDFIIKEIKSQGYKIEIDVDRINVLRPSEVIIYKLVKGIENV